MNSRIAVFFYLFISLWLTLASCAQSSSILTGTVQDKSGALIPGAQVTLRQAETGATLSAMVDAEGNFHIPVNSLVTYQLEVQSMGFKTYRRPIALTAQETAANLSIVLEVEGSTQTVEVTADALAAETTSTQLGENLDNKKIESVPLNGRSFTDLMAVQPGIVPQNTAQPGAVIMIGVASTPPSGDANPGNLSISGQRESSNGFRVNGSDVEEDVNMGTSIVPNLDAIDSFRVLTSNFDAEYGNSSGGQVLVVTKSGLARLHGSAFEFLRNTGLDARNYFSQDRAAYRQNQFGGTLGGQPFRWKNLALFGDYQGTTLTQGIDTGIVAVPTVSERMGDFSGVPLTGSVSGPYLASLLSSKLGRIVTAGEPYAQVFADGQIPISAWSAPARALLQYVPKPNARASLFSTAAETETLQDNKGALRADWTHGKGTLTAYYFVDSYALDNPYPTGTGGASVPGFDAISNGRAQLMNLAHIMTFGNAALNEFHASYMRNANAVGQARGGVGPSLASQGLTGIYAGKPSTIGIESVAFNDFTLGVDTTAVVQTENIYEVSDAFSRILGKHGLKFGGEMHSNQINTHPDAQFNGSFTFNGGETGLDFADFILGAASSYTQGQANYFYNRNLYMAAFVQDSWKAASNFTVNYGVRWDRIRAWSEKFNQLQTLVKDEQSQVFPGAPRGLVFPGDPGVPRSLAPARNDFAPRIGIAWSPAPAAAGPLDKILGKKGSTSVRLGYGIFYTAYEGLSAGIMSANPPYGFSYTSAAPPLFASPFTVAATGADAGQRFPLQKVPFGASRAHPDANVDWNQYEPLVGIPDVDPNDVTPYAEHWMASFERQLGSTLATVSYVGAASHHLLVLEEANPADPNLCLRLGSACGPFNEQAARDQFGPDFGSVELQRTIANANYNALEATLNHKSRGLDLLASYTYSKSNDQSAGLPEPVNPTDPSLSRGLSAYDMRHNVVTSFHYEVPAVAAHPQLFHALESGWGIAGIARFTSGLPVTLLNNNDTSLLGTIPNGINNNGIDTPQWSGASLSLHTDPRNSRAVFDASQLTLPALGTMGNARRRFFSGPGMENFDATLSRSFSVHEGHVMEFRVEAFNVVNHAQFFGATAVEGNVSSGSFGHAVSAMPPRLIQLALRYSF